MLCIYITMQGQGNGGHIPEEEIESRIMATCMSTGGQCCYQYDFIHLKITIHTQVQV